ncbi:MAG: T9SS type A sorting domain-containing protein [Saprospiraceae bacterium]|nr:T9SS type A sorting domain-containing protein [Saprospiraceae bacterium]
MKTGIFYLLLVCFALRLEAQHFQIVDQTDFDNEAAVTASVPGGGMYVAAIAGWPRLNFSNFRLFRYDKAGNELWHYDLPGSERDGVADLLVLPDSSVVVCGNTSGCDVGGYGFIARLSAEGEVLWHVYEDFVTELPFEIYFFNALTVGESGTLYVLGNPWEGSAVLSFNIETGEYLETIGLSPPFNWNTHDVYYRSQEQGFYVAGLQGIHRYMLQTGFLELVVANLPGGGPFLQIVPLNDSLMLTYRVEGDVVVFDQNGVVETHDWTIHGAEHVERNDDGRLAVLSEGKVYVYGPDFEFHQQIEPNLPQFRANTMLWSNDRIVLAGSDKHTNTTLYWNTAMWAQSYDTNGQTFNNVQEVEVLEVIEVQHPVAHNVGVPGSYPYHSITGGAFQVRIRNLSFITLDSVTLNTAFYGYDYPDICPSSSYLVKTFDSLDLGPGEEVVLDLGLVETPFIGFWLGSFNPWKVCVWSSKPNGQADTDHSNNLACLDVFGIVSSTEPEATAFALFPNPATNACTITWGENLKPETVQVYDAFGRHLLSETVDSHAGQHDLELGAWPSGIYMVVLDKAVRRLVKQ